MILKKVSGFNRQQIALGLTSSAISQNRDKQNHRQSPQSHNNHMSMFRGIVNQDPVAGRTSLIPDPIPNALELLALALLDKGSGRPVKIPLPSDLEKISLQVPLRLLEGLHRMVMILCYWICSLSTLGILGAVAQAFQKSTLRRGSRR